MVVLEEAMVDIVVKDLLKLVMAMVVVLLDTADMLDMEDLVVTEGTDLEEAMVDTVVRDLLKLDTTAMVLVSEDMEDTVDTEDLVVMEDMA